MPPETQLAFDGSEVSIPDSMGSGRFEVIMRVIEPDGFWEEWSVQVAAENRPAALSKVLRRKSWAEHILDTYEKRARLSIRVERA